MTDSDLSVFTVGGDPDDEHIVVPTTRFVWPVKYVEVEKLNQLQRTALDVACPLFASFDSESFRDSFGPVKEAECSRQRRFAGDSTLPRGRYYSVLNEDGRFDDLSLLFELYAYHDPAVSGVVRFIDHMDEYGRARYARQRITVIESQHITLTFEPVNEEELTPIGRKVGLSAGDTAVVAIPYEIEKMEINNVLDLRFRETQKWFVDYFGGEGGDQLWVRGFKKHRFERFSEMLPMFYHETRGGSDFTSAIGFWLRRRGIEALVFPSSRSDSSVEFEEGQLKRFSGWSLIDYRGAPEPAVAVLVDASIHYDMRVPEHFKIFESSDGPARGSWNITGSERRSQQDCKNE